jgi:hypothetical protein
MVFVCARVFARSLTLTHPLAQGRVAVPTAGTGAPRTPNLYLWQPLLGTVPGTRWGEPVRLTNPRPFDARGSSRK